MSLYELTIFNKNNHNINQIHDVDHVMADYSNSLVPLLYFEKEQVVYSLDHHDNIVIYLSSSFYNQGGDMVKRAHRIRSKSIYMAPHEFIDFANAHIHNIEFIQTYLHI